MTEMIKIKKSDIFTSKLATWVIMLTCFSYPITTVVFLLVGIPTAPANIALKGFFVFLYIVLFLLGLSKNKSVINPLSFPLIIFFLIYSVRLFVDTSFLDIPMKNEYTHMYLYLYYYALTVLPCISLFAVKDQLNFSQIVKYSGVFLVLINISYLLYFVSQGSGTFLLMLSSRAEVYSDTLEGGTVINPIIVGVFGASLALFEISKLVQLIKVSFARKFFGLLFITMGIANIMLGASRGPVLILILGSVILGAFYFKYRYFQASKLLSLVGIGFVFLYIFQVFVGSLFSDSEIFLFKRLSDSVGSNVKEARDYSFQGAINDFLDSPIIGKQFVGTYDNFYPHNIYLEVFMATGVLGALFFYWALYQVFHTQKLLWRMQLPEYYLPLFIIGIANLIVGLTSGGISTSQQFWIFLTLLILLKNKASSKKKHQA